MPAKRLINGGTMLPLRGVPAVNRSLEGIDGVNARKATDYLQADAGYAFTLKINQIKRKAASLCGFSFALTHEPAPPLFTFADELFMLHPSLFK